MPTLADVLRQTGYSQDGTLVAPASNSPMTTALSEHIKGLPQQFAANQAQQMSLLNQSFPGNTYESMMTQGDPKAMAELAMQVPFNALTAYHGTPNVIKEGFDIAKAGTTAKANNFGHGIYFAESPDVAGMYMAARNKISGPTEGNLYKVDIPDALIPKMLNWYEEVPENVRKKISAKAMEQFGSGISPTTGEKLYKEIAFSLKQAGSKTPEADASKWLLEQGIPGIKYENMQMVKGQGTGTNNYVMFDPTQVKMLDKFENKLDRKELIESQIKALKDAGE
jgi:hypothetical protein